MKLLSLLGIAAIGFIAAVYRPSPLSPVAGSLSFAAHAAPAPAGCDANTKGADFVSLKVRLLTPPYDPRTFIGPGNKVTSPIPAESVYAKDIAAAFDMAPKDFKNELCGLSAVFVTTAYTGNAFAPNWGMRAFKEKGNPGKYLAISTALWSGGDLYAREPISYDQYTSEELKQLLFTIANRDLSSWQNPPWMAPSLFENPKAGGPTSILAALAHEAGHVIWYDQFVNPPGGPINPDAVNSFCGGFYDRWGHKVDVPPGRWLSFGVQNDKETYHIDYYGRISSNLTQPSPDFNKATTDVKNLLNDPELPSALAAASPDENFAEMYESAVLNGVSVPRYRVKIPVNKEYVRRKATCFLSLH